ncbi:DUF1697 domain-containing protein [Granulicatella seriolae]|uniref:DUF1697 domain-containing protein n=1 Tax=Granulicatella seriolae TaxID=2967226 RepID=A0ABT1WNN2_9LACT|nr:DUF1697 domain-containing protein [Granulicatella seriolae]
MKYILLLRGVNVGGKNKVSMTELKELMAKAGFLDLSSYINSGNIFFTSQDTYELCCEKIVDILEENYDFPILFALISKEDYLQDREKLPDWWQEDLARKDVLFFSQQLEKVNVLDFLAKMDFYNEIVHVGDIAIYWGKYDETEFLKTSYHKKLLKQDFYKQITIRNGNTFEKIAELLVD